jgi:hypothetical protein
MPIKSQKRFFALPLDIKHPKYHKLRSSLNGGKGKSFNSPFAPCKSRLYFPESKPPLNGAPNH